MSKGFLIFSLFLTAGAYAVEDLCVRPTVYSRGELIREASERCPQISTRMHLAEAYSQFFYSGCYASMHMMHFQAWQICRYEKALEAKFGDESTIETIEGKLRAQARLAEQSNLIYKAVVRHNYNNQMGVVGALKQVKEQLGEEHEAYKMLRSEIGGIFQHEFSPWIDRFEQKRNQTQDDLVALVQKAKGICAEGNSESEFCKRLGMAFFQMEDADLWGVLGSSPNSIQSDCLIEQQFENASAVRTLLENLKPIESALMEDPEKNRILELVRPAMAALVFTTFDGRLITSGSAVRVEQSDGRSPWLSVMHTFVDNPPGSQAALMPQAFSHVQRYLDWNSQMSMHLNASTGLMTNERSRAAYAANPFADVIKMPFKSGDLLMPNYDFAAIYSKNVGMAPYPAIKGLELRDITKEPLKTEEKYYVVAYPGDKNFELTVTSCSFKGITTDFYGNRANGFYCDPGNVDGKDFGQYMEPGKSGGGGSGF